MRNKPLKRKKVEFLIDDKIVEQGYYDPINERDSRLMNEEAKKIKATHIRFCDNFKIRVKND